MPKKLKIGNAILCEYATLGANNKHVLVNVFSGDIIVQNLPADIPLCVYIEVFRRDITATDTFKMEVRLDNKPLIMGEIVMPGGSQTAVILLPQFPLHIDAAATIEVVITSIGYAKTVALSKRVYQGVVGNRPT